MLENTQSLCVNCDMIQIRKEAIQNASDMAVDYNIDNLCSYENQKTAHDFFDQCLSQLYAEYGMCRTCYDEDHADDWDED